VRSAYSFDERPGKEQYRRTMAASAALPLSLPERIAFQAEFIVTNLLRTNYQHTDDIDVDRGWYYCDCNGFMAFVLRRFAPGHFASVPSEAGHSRPRAFKYHDFFADLAMTPVAGWKNVEFLRHVKRGDLMAWRAEKIEAGSDTGHVFLAAETPNATGTNTFSLRVYDSAITPHFSDTRGSGEKKSGVGSGIINFTVDTAGTPIAFQFGPPVSNKFEARSITVGRLVDVPPPA
jgi:hypothetical protein